MPAFAWRRWTRIPRGPRLQVSCHLLARRVPLKSTRREGLSSPGGENSEESAARLEQTSTCLAFADREGDRASQPDRIGCAGRARSTRPGRARAYQPILLPPLGRPSRRPDSSLHLSDCRQHASSIELEKAGLIRADLMHVHVAEAGTGRLRQCVDVLVVRHGVSRRPDAPGLRGDEGCNRHLHSLARGVHDRAALPQLRQGSRR